MEVNRRSAMMAAAAAAATPSVARSTAVIPSQTFVLVHGAWHGGWCWRDVQPLLERVGHRVLTPTLSGMGERAHLARPDTGLATHVDDLTAVLACEEVTRAVVVGHSYGGYPATLAAAANPGRVARLILLDALVPTAGRAVTSASTPDMMARATGSLLDGFRLPPPPPGTFDVPDGTPGFAWDARRLTAMPWKALNEPVPDFALPAELGITYIRCAASTLAGAKAAAIEARRAGWRTETLDAGHDAMVTAPDRLAALLLQLGADQ